MSERRYCFGALDADGEACNGEVEAENFDDALAMAWDRARQRLGGGPVRITTLTEILDFRERSPIALALALSGDANLRLER